MQKDFIMNNHDSNEEVRIALLEQNSKETKDSLINIQADIKAIGKQVDNVLNAKILDHSHIEAEIATMKEQLRSLEKNNNLWKFLSPTLSAIIAASITFLFMFYLQHIK